MKKLVFAAVLALVSLTTYAQEEVSESEVLQSEVVEATHQEVFTEIEISDLPEAVTDSVAKDYPRATVSKAYVNEEKQYKLEVALEDGTSGTLYADGEGNWISI